MAVYIPGPCYRCTAETVFIVTLPAPIVGTAKPLTWAYLCHDCQGFPIGRKRKKGKKG